MAQPHVMLHHWRIKPHLCVCYITCWNTPDVISTNSKWQCKCSILLFVMSFKSRKEQTNCCGSWWLPMCLAFSFLTHFFLPFHNRFDSWLASFTRLCSTQTPYIYIYIYLLFSLGRIWREMHICFRRWIASSMYRWKQSLALTSSSASLPISSSLLMSSSVGGTLYGLRPDMCW